MNENLRVAILKILAKKRLRLFGCLLYRFDLRATESDDMKTACCTIDKILRKPVIIINSNFISKLENVEQVMFVVLHEMLHFIDGHLSKYRIVSGNDYVFNLAADHVINSLLEKEALSSKLIEVPSDAFMIPELKNQNLDVMEVYEWLMDNKEFYHCKYNQETGMIDVFKNNKYVGSISPDLDNEAEESSDLLDEIKAEIRSVMNTFNTKGSNHDDLFKYIEELVKINIPWESILDNEIQKSRIKSPCNKTWKKLRKKLLHLSITLPGTDTDDDLDDLYLIQDTSGSLWNDEKEHSKIVTLLSESINYFRGIKVIQHDVEVTNSFYLTRDNFENEKHKMYELRGGGGTSHKEAFSFIENDYFEMQEKIGMVILSTDYESDIEQIWNNYEFHNYVPVKVLCSNKNVNINKMVDSSPIFC